MYQVIIVFHVLFGLGIIGLVLMQQGKGADAGAAFGAGASGTVFGAQGAASFLSRTTAIFATLFFTTSLGLAIYNSQSGVAYDLMSDKSSEQDSVPVSESGAKKSADSLQIPAGSEDEKPVTVPTISSETPAVPEQIIPGKTVEPAVPAPDPENIEPVEINSKHKEEQKATVETTDNRKSSAKK